MCKAWPANVTSPTFVLINEYAAARPIYHFDAYRINDDDEFLELGVDEYFQSDGVCLVEWASRVSPCLPRDFLRIEIEVLDETARRFKLEALGQRYEAMLARLRAKIHVELVESADRCASQFNLVDLISQRDAVRRQLAGKSREEIEEWFACRGRLERLRPQEDQRRQKIQPNSYYFFESAAGIQATFFLDENNDLFFNGFP